MEIRKNYFVKKRFQMNFLSRFVILLLLESLLIAGLLSYVSRDTLTTGYLNSTLRIEKTPDFFFISLILIVLITVVAMGLAGMVIFILLSHRIAGPLYRFEKTLKEAQAGDLTVRINLRKTDQLTEFKESMNSLFESTDIRIGRIKQRITELEKAYSKLDAPAAQTLKSKIDAIKDEIGYFKVTPTSKE